MIRDRKRQSRALMGRWNWYNLSGLYVDADNFVSNISCREN
jgi:hypothetical protein